MFYMAWSSPNELEGALDALFRPDDPATVPGSGWPLAILPTLDRDVLRGDLLGLRGV